MGEVFKLNHCYNMDCLPAMELFPDNYFDLAVVDPPYFSGPERRGFYGSKVSKIGVHRDYPVSPAWSKPEPEYFRELFRVCRHYIVWGCNYFDYQFATGRIVWDKCNGNSSFSDCEIAATNLFSSVRMFRYMWSGMMQGKSITEGDTIIHRCAGKRCRTSVETQSLWAETPIYIKRGRSRAWQEVHIPEHPCTRENKRVLKNSASTHSR